MCNHFSEILILFLLLLITFNMISFRQAAAAQSEEQMKILLMFYKEEDLVVTPTRRPEPLSQVAENITVITSEEIEMINAHTLTDVLNNIPGVQMDIKGGPGSVTNAHIQGSGFRHVLVMIDGVTLNNLSDNFADIGAITVRNIERLEIIKGPASSSWGSSLGGIINIITKPAGDSQKIGGSLSASYGERNTGDYSAEVSGRAGNSGYYIYAGNLDSDGLTANTPGDENNLYTKLRWDATDRGSLIFTFGNNKGKRGMGEYPEFDLSFKNDFEYLFSTLSLDYSINNEADLHLSFRTSRQDTEFITNQLSTGMELQRDTLDDSTYGGSANFMWKYGIHNMALGFDFDDGKVMSKSITGGRQVLEKWAIFSNDTIIIDRFSFTPGIRYDYTNTNGDFLSPSLGITSGVTEKTIFRAYFARGFNIPPLSSTFGTGFFSVPNPDLEVEKVWSIQAGIESTELKYLWFKTTFFSHNIWNAVFNEELLDPNGTLTGTFTAVNKEKQRRQGVEAEVKTVPFYNTSLFAGFCFVDAKDRDTRERLIDIPRYTYDIGVNYNNNKSFMAYLKGHYIWWHAHPSNNGRYHNFIWDINLMKKFYRGEKSMLDAFLTAHNIFNGSQYLVKQFKNPGRWIEAGIRYKF